MSWRRNRNRINSASRINQRYKPALGSVFETTEKIIDKIQAEKDRIDRRAEERKAREAAEAKAAAEAAAAQAAKESALVTRLQCAVRAKHARRILKEARRQAQKEARRLAYIAACGRAPSAASHCCMFTFKRLSM